MSESIEAKQLRSRLGSYLNQVQEGLTVIVTRQGQAIAELRPCNMEQAGQEMQNGAREEPQDEVVLQPPAPTGIGALGLTTYVCQTGQVNQMTEPSEEVTEDESPAQESQPEQVVQTEMAAVAVDAESAEMVSPASAKPAKRARPSRSRKAKTAASPKRGQSRGTSARKKSS
jgi:antitoxin (DNA-binding transcriptional repressor) of toxin-antitoxin stability system